MRNDVNDVLLEMYRLIKSSENDSEILCLSTIFLGSLFLAFSCNLVSKSIYDLYLEFIKEQYERLKLVEDSPGALPPDLTKEKYV